MPNYVVSVHKNTLLQKLPDLVDESIVFEVTPLPFDFYLITTGPQNDRRMRFLGLAEKPYRVLINDNRLNESHWYDVIAVNREDAVQEAIVSHLDLHVDEDQWADYQREKIAWALNVLVLGA